VLLIFLAAACPLLAVVSLRWLCATAVTVAGHNPRVTLRNVQWLLTLQRFAL